MKNTKDLKTKAEYIARINRVQDYIEKNIDGDLSLDTISKVSSFSKYHFCRIYRAMTSETIQQFINRIRLEKAIGYIISDQDLSITEVALKLGFSDSAVFARAFKRHYGLSASEFRYEYSKNCKRVSKVCKEDFLNHSYNESVSKKSYSDIEGSVDVEVKNIDGFTAIYLRHRGAYGELQDIFYDELMRLFKWSAARDIKDVVPFAIYHDHPEFTDEVNHRTSICLRTSKDVDVDVDRDVGKINIASGKYAIGHFVIGQELCPLAWDYMFGQWLPNSGYQPGDGYIFEMYLNDPSQHPDNICMLDIYVPIKPL